MAPAGEEVEKLPIFQKFRAGKRCNVRQRAVEEAVRNRNGKKMAAGVTFEPTVSETRF